MVVGASESRPGMWTTRMVSVRPAPTSPPVASAACCSGVRSSRLSDPTSSQLVPAPAAGRPSSSLKTASRRNDDSTHTAVAAVAAIATRATTKAVVTIRRNHARAVAATSRNDFRLTGASRAGGRAGPATHDAPPPTAKTPTRHALPGWTVLRLYSTITGCPK